MLCPCFNPSFSCSSLLMDVIILVVPNHKQYTDRMTNISDIHLNFDTNLIIQFKISLIHKKNPQLLFNLFILWNMAQADFCCVTHHSWNIHLLIYKYTIFNIKIICRRLNGSRTNAGVTNVGVDKRRSVYNKYLYIGEVRLG